MYAFIFHGKELGGLLKVKGLRSCMKIGYIVFVAAITSAYGMESVLETSDSVVTEPRNFAFPQDKQQLHHLILNFTDAKPNVVQYARDFLTMHSKQLEAQNPLALQIHELLEHLIQPEDWLQKLTSTEQIDKAVLSLELFARELEKFYREHHFYRTVLKPVVLKYREFMSKYKDNPGHRQFLLLPKAILFTESPAMDGEMLRSYLISQEMALKITSLTGFSSGGVCTFDKRNEKGAHAVCHLIDAEKKEGVHFKANSEQALMVGYEAAIYWFSYVLFGHGQAASSLVTISNIDTYELPENSSIKERVSKALQAKNTMAEFFLGNPRDRLHFTQRSYATVLQASRHIAGTSLDEFIETQVEKGEVTALDEDSFSEQVLLNLLTFQADFKPDNLMVGDDPSEALVGIDNDVAFDRSLLKQKVFKRPLKADHEFKHLISLKNILFLLPAMQAPVSKKVRKAVEKIDPDTFILTWLGLLKDQEQRYFLFKKSTFLNGAFKDQPYLSEHDYRDALCLPITLSIEFVTELKAHIKKIQKYLKSHKGATHWQLFSLVQPVVARYYKAFCDKEKDVITTFFKAIYQKKVDKRIYVEDCVDLDEIIHGKTVRTLLEKVPEPDASVKRYSVSSLAKFLLRQADLIEKHEKKTLAEFFKVISIAFKQEFLDVQDNNELHESWDYIADSGENILIPLMIHSGVDEEVIRWFIEKGGAEILLESENIIVDCLERDLSVSFITFLLEKLKEEYAGLSQESEDSDGTRRLAALLNRTNKNGITALDLAMKKGKRREFRLLIEQGAYACNPKNAVTYYHLMKAPQNSAKDKAAFERLLRRNQAIEWGMSLELLLPEGNPPSAKLPIKGSDGIQRSLPRAVRKQLYKEDLKSFNPVVTEGTNHIVARARVQDTLFPHKTHGIYFKVLPGIPGREEAAGRFMRKLFGCGAPHTMLINMGTPVMLSHEMEGPTLEEAFKSKNPILHKLDPKNISGLIIAAMLINPEDGKPNNIVVIKNAGEDLYSLSIIDNDHGFIAPLEREKRMPLLGKSSIVLRVKTILYCFDLMKEAVHPAIRQRLLEIDVMQFLEEWALELAQVHKAYQKLFTDAEHAKHLAKKSITQGVPFYDDTILKLYDKFVLMQNILKENPRISHLDLLKQIEPGLGKIYEQALEIDETPLVRWERVDGPSYTKTTSGSYVTTTKQRTILHSGVIPGAKDMIEVVTNGEDFTPVQALEKLKEKLSAENEGIVQQLLSRIREKDSSVKKEALSVRQWERILERPSRIFDVKEQKAILKFIQNIPPFSHLVLRHVPEVQPSWFTGFDLSHITKLDLRSCQQLTDIGTIVKGTELLEELNLGGITTLTNVSARSALQENDLNLFKLKRLNLSGCTKLKRVKIAAPFLKYLNVSECPSLRGPMLDDIIKVSRDIEKLDCKNSGIGYGPIRELFPQFLASDLEAPFQGGSLTDRQKLFSLVYADRFLRVAFSLDDIDDFVQNTLRGICLMGNYFELGDEFVSHLIDESSTPVRKKRVRTQVKEKPTIDNNLYASALLTEYETARKNNLEEAFLQFKKFDTYEKDFNRYLFTAEGCYRLALCYKLGKGTAPDIAASVKLFKKAYEKFDFIFPLYAHINNLITHDDTFMVRTHEIPSSNVDLDKAFGIYTFCLFGATSSERETVDRYRAIKKHKALYKSVPIYRTLFRFFIKEILTASKLSTLSASTFHFTEFLHKAADCEMPVAPYNLALAYDHGIGVKKDRKKAVTWYKKFLSVMLEFLEELKIPALIMDHEITQTKPDLIIRFFMDIMSPAEIDAIKKNNADEWDSLLEILQRVNSIVTAWSRGSKAPLLTYNMAMVDPGSTESTNFLKKVSEFSTGVIIIDHRESIFYSPYLMNFMSKKSKKIDFEAIAKELTQDQITHLSQFIQLTFPIENEHGYDERAAKKMCRNGAALEEFLSKSNSKKAVKDD